MTVICYTLSLKKKVHIYHLLRGYHLDTLGHLIREGCHFVLLAIIGFGVVLARINFHEDIHYTIVEVPAMVQFVKGDNTYLFTVRGL